MLPQLQAPGFHNCARKLVRLTFQETYKWDTKNASKQVNHETYVTSFQNI